MKSLFDPAVADELKQRMAQLTPETPRFWGKMAPAQMLAHCSAAMEVSVGDKVMKQVLIGKLLGGMAKAKMLSGKPMGRNMPTDKSYIVSDDRDLDRERRRLSVLIDRFQSGGPEKCARHPHSFFGVMTPEEWSALNYVHLDHHLKQFGV